MDKRRESTKGRLLLLLLLGLGLPLGGLAVALGFFPPLVSLTSAPAGASVYVDCRARVERTPATFLLPFGVHSLVVSSPEGGVWTQPLHLRPFSNQPGLHAALDAGSSTGADPGLRLAWVDERRHPEVRVGFQVLDAAGAPQLDLAGIPLALEERSEEVCFTATPTFSMERTSNLDLVFLIDVTASMSDELAAARDNIERFCDLLLENDLNFRVAGYAFDDSVPYQAHAAFTPEFHDAQGAWRAAVEFKMWLATLRARGGGDGPENSLGAVVAAAQDADFRPDARRVAVLITDTTPHVAGDGGDSATQATFETATEAATGAALQLFAASPRDVYASIGAQPLGWPFDSATLRESLVSRLARVHVIAFRDTAPTSSVPRRFTLRVAERGALRFVLPARGASPPGGLP